MVEAALSLLRIPAVLNLTGLTRPSLYRLIASGDFPAPIRPTERTVAFSSAAVNRWIKEKLAEATGGPLR